MPSTWSHEHVVIRCSRCGFESAPEHRFCGRCGTSLAATCDRCGTEVPPGFRFCGRCGAPLASEPETPPPEPPAARPPPQRAEREVKQATVLACELVCEGPGSSEAEVLHGLLDWYLRLAREEIDELGGTINQVLGSGLVALFGVPVALEDHAVRAVLVATRLRRRLREHSREVEQCHGVRWTAHMGLDTGLVVSGGEGGMAVGEVTEAVHRLLNKAEPGEILLGERLAPLVRAAVALERTGDGTWRIPPHAIPFVDRRRFGEGHTSPFVGRRREIQILEEVLDHARAGRGQVVGIAGEPGVGKSRLLHEFARHRLESQVSSLRGRCLSYASGIPYFPIHDMIRRAARIAHNDSADAAREKLHQVLGLLGLDTEKDAPYLLDLLGLEEHPEPSQARGTQAIQATVFSVMRQMVLEASRKRLVVMEIEDVQWIDTTSEEFLESLIEEISNARILILLTYRTGHRPRWLHKSYATQITTHRLKAQDSRRIVEAVLGPAELGPARIEQVIERGEGNPFYLQELTRSLADDPSPEGEESPIPHSVQGVLMARIDRLPPTHKRLLQIASVLGREIRVDLLETIWDQDEPLIPVLDDLQRWEFLSKEHSERVEGAYYFRHSLTQEVAYQSLLKSRRAALHAEIAGELERLYADHLEDALDLLTYHYPRANHPEKTVLYLTLFAHHAADQFAHAEAAMALRQALEHADRLPEETRARETLGVLLQLAESLLPLARFSETLDRFQSHEPLLRQIDDSSLRAGFHFWQAHTATYLGMSSETRQQARLAIEAAQEGGDQATEGKAWYVLGRDSFWTGKFVSGLEESHRAVVLLERSGTPWWQGQAHWVLGFHHWALGDFERALGDLRRAYEIGRALDDHRLDSSWSIGFVETSIGRWDEGVESCRAGMERTRDPLNEAVSMGFFGHALLHRGEIGPATEHLAASIRSLSEAGMQQLLGWFTVTLAEAQLAGGRIREARETANEGLLITAEAEFRYGMGLAHRALGRISAAEDLPDRARRELETALESFEALEMPLEIANTRLALAALPGPESAAHLTEADRLYEALGLEGFPRAAAAAATAARASRRAGR